MSAADELAAAEKTLQEATSRSATTATPAVAALLRAREPIAQWLEFARNDAERLSRVLGDGPDQWADPHALAVARAINGSST
jgi:hypothetical protein